MGSREIFDLRRQGRQKDALEMARAQLPGNENDIWLLRAYAWALYDHVKGPVDEYEGNRLSPSAMSRQIEPYMREFARIASPLRGDAAFSQMLRLAGKVAKDWPDFLQFARWAGTDDFASEDKVPFQNEQGRKIDSLQKRFTRAICRETVARYSDQGMDRDLISWGQDVLRRSLDEDPDDQWLNYYQSKLDLLAGDVEQAIRSLTPVLRRQSKAAWTWALLGEILESSRREDAIVCLAYATQLAREEQEVAKVRVHLAHLLARAERFGEAANEAKLAVQFREQHGYKIPSELAQLLASDWYKAAIRDGDTTPFPNAAKEAYQILHGLNRNSLTFAPGVIDHINEEKALSYVATSASDGFALLHRKFPGVAKLPPGTVIEVGRVTADGPPLDWRETTANSLPGVCETFSGVVERHEGKSFAFLRATCVDVFVPPDLASDFSVGELSSRTCVAVRRANRQGKVGWRAVGFLNDPQ